MESWETEKNHIYNIEKLVERKRIFSWESKSEISVQYKNEL